MAITRMIRSDTPFYRCAKAGGGFCSSLRFISGGVAENTPKSRDFAVRFIHAPMLSLFSGFHWTDTTQGYRAYSRKMLLDTKISLFRDVFMTYELLAYLSYRAPSLVIDALSCRRYGAIQRAKCPPRSVALKATSLCWKCFCEHV